MRPGRTPFRSLPWPARLLIGAAGLAGCIVLVERLGAAVYGGGAGAGWTGVLLLLLAIALGPRTVNLGLKVEMSAALPFIFTALLSYGLPLALDVAGAAVLATCLLRKNPFEPHRILFNVASILITVRAAGGVFHLIAVDPSRLVTLPVALGLTAAILTYYAVNSATIASVIGLSRGTSIYQIWRDSFAWTFVSYFAGGSLAFVMAELLRSEMGAVLLVLSLPPVLLLQRSYRLHLERMEERRERLEAVEQLNAELELKVEQRTHELREANEQLQISNEELKRANRLKSEFLANMSHELRTPLNAIIGFSELLEEGSYGALSESQKDFVRDIHESGRHLLSLINGILDLSKIEAGRMTLNREEFSIPAMVRECVSVVRPLAIKKDLVIDAELDSAPVVAWADSGMLKQVLYNLLSNAVKFTPEGGSVRVRAWEDGRDLMIAVVDSGIGIAPQDQERIFTEFYQVDGSYARKYQGTGLGLALVKRFVEMHGGVIGVASEPGKGSTFTLRIPWGARAAESDPAETPVVAVEETPREAVAPGSRGRVLLVEDNPANMKLARSLLLRGGFEVVEARTGEEALARLAEPKLPDVILMDVQLPGMDGLELTRRILSTPRTAGLPVIALTAHVMKGDQERALQAGCVGYIPKPIDAARFCEVVSGTLAARVG